MKLTKGEWSLVVFNLTYILAAAIYFINKQNYEFLIYIGVLIFFFALVAGTIRKTKFDSVILWGLSLWGLMHMLGGSLIVNGKVLYALKIVQLVNVGDNYILRFDQVVHFFGFFICTLIAWHLIKPYLNNKTNYKVVYALVALVGIGLGALNEVAEFVTVILLPQTGVGGYYNTALDLVFNMLGAIAAVIWINWRRKLKND